MVTVSATRPAVLLLAELHRAAGRGRIVYIEESDVLTVVAGCRGFTKHPKFYVRFYPSPSL